MLCFVGWLGGQVRILPDDYIDVSPRNRPGAAIFGADAGVNVGVHDFVQLLGRVLGSLKSFLKNIEHFPKPTDF